MNRPERKFLKYLEYKNYSEAYRFAQSGEFARVNLLQYGEDYMTLLLNTFVETRGRLIPSQENRNEEPEAFLQIVEFLSQNGISTARKEWYDSGENKKEVTPAFLTLLHHKEIAYIYQGEESLEILLRLREILCREKTYYTKEEQAAIYKVFYRQPAPMQLLELLEKKGFCLPSGLELADLLTRAFLAYANCGEDKQKYHLDVLYHLLKNDVPKASLDILAVQVIQQYAVDYRRIEIERRLNKLNKSLSSCQFIKKIIEEEELLDTLIARGADVNGAVSKGSHLPWYCIKNFTLPYPVLNKIKEYGIDFERPNKDGDRPFTLCLKKRNFTGAVMLLLCGADSSPSEDGLADPLFMISEIWESACKAIDNDESMPYEEAQAGPEAFVFDKIVLPRHNRGDNVLKRDILGKNFIDMIYEKHFRLTNRGRGSLSFDLTPDRPNKNRSYSDLVNYLTEKLSELGYSLEDIHPRSLFDNQEVEYFNIFRIIKDPIQYIMRLPYNWNADEILRKTKSGDNFLTYLFKYSNLEKFNESFKGMEEDAEITSWNIEEEPLRSGLQKHPIALSGHLQLLCNDFDRSRQSPAYCILEKLARMAANEVGGDNATAYQSSDSEKSLMEHTLLALLIITNTENEYLSAASHITGKNCLDLAGEIAAYCAHMPYTGSMPYVEGVHKIYQTLLEKVPGFSYYKDRQDGKVQTEYPEQLTEAISH